MFKTILHAIENHARASGDRLALRFIRDDLDHPEEIRYAELAARVDRLAAMLEAAGLAGERVLIACPSGLDYVLTVLACFRARAIAVPYLPVRRRGLSKFEAVVADAGARAVVVETAADAAALRALCSDGPDVLSARDPQAARDRDDTARAVLRPLADAADASAIAYLQYTSGSTSRPKGVIVTHANLMANVGMIAHAFAQDESSSWLGWLPLHHDMGLVSTIMLPLALGITATFMAPMSFMQDPLIWLRAISRFRITTSGGPNFAYDLLLQSFDAGALQGIDLSSWSVAFNGAESVRAETLEAFARRYECLGFAATAMKPCYGLAEATLIVSAVRRRQAHRLSPGPDGRHRVAVGAPVVPGVVWLRDADGRMTQQSGVVGEVCIGGPSVTRGYWGRDEAADVFAQAPSGPLLRTGDLGYLDQGELVICGRTKELLIVRGRNFYPQDVESVALALRTSLPLLACAAFTEEDESSTERSVLVVEVHRHASTSDHAGIARAIRQAVLDTLELSLDRIVLCRPRGIPLTTSGKIQRVGCRVALATGDLPVVHDDVAGAFPARDAIALPMASPRDAFIALVERHLGVAIEGHAEDATLIELGFDSLSLSRLSAALFEAAGTRLPLSLLHEGTSLGEICTRLRREASSVQAPLEVQALEGADQTGRPSEGQLSLCLLQQAYGTSNRFLLVRAIAVDAPAEQAAVARVADLLTTMASPFEALFSHGPHRLAARASIVREHDVAAGAALESWLASEVARDWHPESDALFELALAHVGAGSMLVLRAHHAVCDLESLRLLLDAAVRVLAGNGPVARFGRPGRLASREAARWRGTRALQAQDALAQLLRPPVPYLDLARAPHLRAPGRVAGRSASRVLSDAVHGRIAGLCRRLATTEHVVLTAMTCCAIAAVTGERDLVFGTPVDARESEEDFHTIDNFANLQPMRARLQAGEGIDALVLELRAQAASMSGRRDYPFSQLVGSLQPERLPGRSPLFEVLVCTHRAATRGEAALILGQDGEPFELGASMVRSLGCPVADLPFDLRLDVVHCPGETLVKIDFRHEIVDATTVDRLLDAFGRVLDGPIVSAASIDDQEGRPDAAGLEPSIYGPRAQARADLVEQILNQARSHPDRVAVIDRAGEHTYRSLADRSAAVARTLAGSGIGPGSAVAVALPRGRDLVAALLGTWRAGCMYVPLPDTMPAERQATLVELARCSVVLDAGFMSTLDDVGEDEPARADALAYRIFTSGTTGRPKCVEITHHALANVVGAMQELLQLTPLDRVAATTSIGFDIAGLELWWPLAVGASIAMLGPEEAMDAARLQSAIEHHDVTVLQGTPSWYSNLVQSGWPGHPRLRVLCGGERLDWSLARQLQLRCQALWNVYGPTETTIWSSAFRVDAGVAGLEGASSVPLGSPLDATSFHVLDESLAPVARGAEGDLYIGGAGLARGYFDDPDLTASRFVQSPFLGGQRIYRTGDRVARTPDGALVFRGRLDRQVKISGHRLELAEVEAHLLSLPGIRQACAFARSGHDGQLELCAAIVGAHGVPDRPSDIQIRRQLAKFAPDYAIPGRLRWFDVLPLNANGKACTATLSRLIVEAPGPLPPPLPLPASGHPSLEAIVLAAWQQVLGRPIDDRDASFFDLGGTSLQLNQVRHLLEGALGRAVDMLDLLQARSASDLSRHLLGEASPTAVASPLRRDRATSSRRRSLLSERTE